MNQPDYLIKTFPIILLFMIAASACNQSHENNEGVKDKKEANLNSGRQTNAMNDTLTCNFIFEKGKARGDSTGYSYQKQISNSFCISIIIDHVYDPELGVTGNFKNRSKLICEYLFNGNYFLFADSTSNEDFQMYVLPNSASETDIDNDSLLDFRFFYAIAGTDAGEIFYFIINDGKVYRSQLTLTHDGINSFVNESYEVFSVKFPKEWDQNYLLNEYKKLCNYMLDE